MCAHTIYKNGSGNGRERRNGINDGAVRDNCLTRGIIYANQQYQTTKYVIQSAITDHMIIVKKRITIALTMWWEYQTTAKQ